MAITRTPIVDDDGTGTTGTVIDNAWKTELYNQIDALTAGLGAWVNVPYVASDFTATAGMTWTVTAGNVAFNRYTLIGKTLFWLVYIEASTLAGTPGPQLFIKFPPGLIGKYKRGVVATTQLYDGASSRGWARVNVDHASLIVEKDPSANFAINTGTTYVEFTIIVEVN